MRGGQIIDFVTDLPPIELPVQVYGEYWHRADLTPLEWQRLQDIYDEYKIPPAIIWAGEAETQEDANQVFLRKVIGLENLFEIFG